ncbi:hypothetical protein GCM10010483_10760 [Actinokineospora diospyrosa]
MRVTFARGPGGPARVRQPQGGAACQDPPDPFGGRRGVTRWVAGASPWAASTAKMFARPAVVIAATPVFALTAAPGCPSTSVTTATATSGLAALAAAAARLENHPTG